MKFLVFLGSPRKSGNCVQIIHILSDVLIKEKHEVKVVHVYDQIIKGCIGCMACSNGTVEYCIHKDDFTKLAPEIVAADALIFAAPVYMGHVPGPFKTLLDRFYTFLRKDFSVRLISGKKCATIVTSGAPKDVYYSVTSYLKQLLISFFKLNFVGGIHFGDLKEHGIAANNPEIVQDTEDLAKAFLKDC